MTGRCWQTDAGQAPAALVAAALAGCAEQADPATQAEKRAVSEDRATFAAAAGPLCGMMISGRMTPARICVAPEIDAFCPAWAESNANVLGAMGIVPKPSVRINVKPTCSVPVIATPKS